MINRIVEGHKSKLLAKTGSKSLAGLVIYAFQYKLLNIKDFPFTWSKETVELKGSYIFYHQGKK